MPKFFYAGVNTDSDGMYQDALIGAGYLETLAPSLSQFIVHDAVHPRLEHCLSALPNFIVPHTPQSSFLWDGILGTGIPTCCNFVYGEAGREVLASYGYPHRVEVIGFSRCVVRPFKPTAPGRNLLIIPSHALQGDQYTYPGYIEWVLNILRFVLEHRKVFDRIVLCWGENRFDPALMAEMKRQGFEIIPTNPYFDKEPLKNMMVRIEQSNLVLSCGTAGCVSVAMGKPTVFFSELGGARSFPRDALHPGLYDHLLRFPLAAEKMDIEEILDVRKAQNSKVELWKQRIIGGNFDAKKFLSVVGEYVK